MAFNFGGSSAPAPSFTFGSSSAPAPSGGFSFGGAAAPAATAAAPSSGFSFGSSAPAPSEAKKDDAKASAPAPSGGFSFGGAAAPATSPASATVLTPVSKTDDNKPSTPAPSQFSFGSSTPSAGVNTPAGVSTPSGVETPAGLSTPAFKNSEKDPNTSTSQSTVAKIEPPPTTYQNQTVEEIINSLSQSLEMCSIQFLNQARRIASQDELLRISQNDIYNLSNQLSTLLVQQEELDQRLTQVGDVQNNLIAELDTLEGQVDALFVRSVGALEGGSIDDADAERERYFSLAIETEGRLTNLEEEIEIVEKNLKSLRNLNIDNSNDDLGKILNTMNQNHDLLSTLEGRCAKVESDMRLVSKSM